MKNKKTGSFLLTFFCAALILGVGYLGIVKGGKIILGTEEKPQKANFEDTGSNVFFGKIEDDIQLFPWNYYGQNEVENFEKTDEEAGRLKLLQEKVYSMEAVHCGVERETIDKLYEKKGSTILKNVRVFDTEYGLIFFYQDTLEVQGKQYQVKAAFDEFVILNFTCIETREEGARQTEIWKEGKEKLKEMLDNYSNEIYTVMFNIEELEYLSSGELNVMLEYYMSSDKLETPYDQKIIDKEKKSLFVESYAVQVENLQKMLSNDNMNVEAEDEMWIMGDNSSYDDIGEYSYQIIELDDVILLLVQGEYMCQGVYYDPITQKFCGYNLFVQ